MYSKGAFHGHRINFPIVMILTCSLSLVTLSSSLPRALYAAEPVRAHEFVRLTIEAPTSGLTYSYVVDSNESTRRKLSKDNSFSLTSGVDIVVEDFNPLLYCYSSKETILELPSSSALSGLLGALVGLPGLIGQTEASEGNPIFTMIAPLQQQPSEDEKPSEKCALLIKAADELRNAVKALSWSIEEDELKGWIADAHGRAGIKEVQRRILERKGKLKGEVATAERELLEFNKAIEAVRTEKTRCAELSSPSFATNLFVVSQCALLVQRQKRVLKSFDPLLAQLKVADTPYLWNGDNFIVVREVVPREGSDVQQDVTFVENKLTLEDGVIAIEAGRSATATLHFVSYSSIDWRPSAGTYYSNLKQRSFGTEQADGGLIVTEARSHDVGWQPAVLANGIFHTDLLGTHIEPLVQIGVGTAPDYPAILAGAGLNFDLADFPAIVLSGGFAFTWQKVLDDQLPVGSPVSGTADIESHLTDTEGDAAAYISIQLAIK